MSFNVYALVVYVCMCSRAVTVADFHYTIIVAERIHIAISIENVINK